MSEHLSPKQLQQYLGGRLPADRLLSIDSHLATCQSCQEQLHVNERLAAGVADLRQDFRQAVSAPLTHLTWEQLSDLVDQKLDAVEQEMAESHLQICQDCLDELTALHQFTDHLATFPAKELAPPSRPSWLKKTQSFFGLTELFAPNGGALSLLGALRFAGAAALLAIIIWGGFRFWRARNPVVNVPEIAGHETVTPTPTTSATPQAIPAETPVSLLALNDGGKQIGLDASGKVSGINFISPADEKLVSNALRSGKVETSAELKQLSSPGSGLMGRSSAETFHLLSPTGRIIAATRPTLRWQALNGASGYIVTIANPQTNFVLSSATLTATQWKPTQPLLRGQTYTWQVTAIKEGKEIKSPPPDAPDAQFRILSQTQFDEVTRAEKAYAGNHLMLGLVYARSGLLDEAEAHFSALLAANPKSALARQLLQSIRSKSKG